MFCFAIILISFAQTQMEESLQHLEEILSVSIKRCQLLESVLENLNRPIAVEENVRLLMQDLSDLEEQLKKFD